MFIRRVRGGKREPMHPYRCPSDHSGGGHSQGRPRRRRPGRDRQASGHPERAGEPGAGYKRLVDWAEEFGPLKHAGVEGTGSFGAGLAHFLKGRRIKVSEVIRPKRRDQYRAGKSDPIDAEAAARAVLASTATGQPKSADGEVEMIRTLRITRRSAAKARVGAANQLQNLLITAPEGLKSELCGLSTARLVTIASRFRPGPNPSDVEAATKFALRSVARRYQRLSEEISSTRRAA